jgi:thymidylate kinase
MPMKYHKKINASFLKIAKENSKRFVVIDASKDKEEIGDIIWKNIKDKLLSD